MEELTREQLEFLYESMDNKDLCHRLGITNPTLISLLKRHDIPLKGKGNRTERYKITIKE